jgi:hypothetical protein
MPLRVVRRRCADLRLLDAARIHGAAGERADWIARWDADGDGADLTSSCHAAGTNLDFFPMGERHGLSRRSCLAARGVRIGLAVGDYGAGHSDQLAVLDVAPDAERVLFYGRLGGSATPIAQVPRRRRRSRDGGGRRPGGDGYDIAVSVRKPDVGFGCITDAASSSCSAARADRRCLLSVSAGPVEGRRYDRQFDANGDGTADL